MMMALPMYMCVRCIQKAEGQRATRHKAQITSAEHRNDNIQGMAILGVGPSLRVPRIGVPQRCVSRPPHSVRSCGVNSSPLYISIVLVRIGTEKLAGSWT